MPKRKSAVKPSAITTERRVMRLRSGEALLRLIVVRRTDFLRECGDCCVPH